jgi:hypothetical protein
MQRKIVGDFAEGGGEETEGCGYFSDAVAVRVPGSGGQRERQLVGEVSRDSHALRSECGEGADSAAELENQGAIVEREEADPMAQESVEPTGDDEAER